MQYFIVAECEIRNKIFQKYLFNTRGTFYLPNYRNDRDRRDEWFLYETLYVKCRKILNDKRNGTLNDTTLWDEIL